MNRTPPNSKRELFDRLRHVIRDGWQTIPSVKRYHGHGGPGNFLEDLLGLKVGNQDIADSVGWEIKYYTKKTSLITLFHKEASPPTIMRHMVSRWGWKDDHGRKSFRHTIKGRSPKFKVVEDSGQIIVRPLKGNGPVPIWTHNDLLNIAGGKLRRLLLVEGTRDGNKIRFLRADCFENLHLENFIYEVMRGTVCIDFDVREMKPGSKGLRNHGTKFRVSPNDVCRLYTKKERFT
ncbi:MAG: hypothetical protein F4Z68_07900 [Nitrospira sp. SB0667_bin_9]|nr:hypothetical protein [Nitrospira sp. SB0667_bin_9]MYD31946.1 hypothetical protein [Nitrospira sp. SB0661_bin_20]MYJ21886.1 hypothetical protein [Nitrospira sp. SB0673_bin_12]